MYGFIKPFQNKLKLWENQIRNKNMFHYSIATYSAVDFKSFADELQYLNSELSKRFEDFCKQEVDIEIFLLPFSSDGAGKAQI